MRLIHTADWHLGHKLHEVDRREEHEAFLDWLVETIREREADALLMSGDVFDTANPSAEAQELWYRFLARCRRRNPDVDIVVIGGNHDSAGRLDAPNPLLRELGVHIVGGLPRSGREVLIEDLLKPIADRDGNIGAWVAAVPFLRTPDLPPVEADDPLVAGVAQLYGQILDAARDKADNSGGGDCAVIAMGHLYLSGTSLSEMSERKVLGGNQHALPVGMFPEDIAYVALGHLHLPQEVGRENVRYSGSPVPLSISERGYPHQVVEVVLEGARFVGWEAIPIPRTRDLLRIPDTGALPPSELLAELVALPNAPALLTSEAVDGEEGADAGGMPPLLQVAALLERPEPSLRHDVEQALEGKHARLVTLTVEHTGHGGALADQDSAGGLAEVDHEQVFRLAWTKSYQEDPPPDMLAAFHELVDHVTQGGDR